MRFYTYITILLTFFSCNSKGLDNAFLNLKSIDSCGNAVSFENIAIAEAMVDKNYSGDLKNYYGSDTTKIDFIHHFRNGKLVSSEFYYDNGQIQEEYKYLCGSLHGEQKFYYKKGALAKVIPYRYGRTNGVGKLYDEKGTLRQEVVLVNGSIVTSKDFDSNGKLVSQ